MFRSRYAAVIMVAGLILAPGCKDKEIRDEDPNKRQRISMEMGVTEVADAAEDMKNQLANFQFPAEDIALYKDGRVRCRVLTVENRTSEHFDVTILTDRIKKTMLSSGKIVCVADRQNLGELQQEKEYQDAMAKEGTKAKQAAETGARYALIGRIKADKKRNEDIKVNNYIFTLILVNTETTEELLQSEKMITIAQNR